MAFDRDCSVTATLTSPGRHVRGLRFRPFQWLALSDVDAFETPGRAGRQAVPASTRVLSGRGPLRRDLRLYIGKWRAACLPCASTVSWRRTPPFAFCACGNATGSSRFEIGRYTPAHASFLHVFLRGRGPGGELRQVKFRATSIGFRSAHHQGAAEYDWPEIAVAAADFTVCA